LAAKSEKARADRKRRRLALEKNGQNNARATPEIPKTQIAVPAEPASSSYLEGSFSFALSAPPDAGLTTWGDPVVGNGRLELAIDGPVVAGRISLIANTGLPFNIMVEMSGELIGINHRNNGFVVLGRVPWQAQDMTRCLRVASNAQGCQGEGFVKITGRRAGSRFEGRWSSIAGSGRLSQAGQVIPLSPEDVMVFETLYKDQLSIMRAAGVQNLEYLLNEEWAK
jgi:hypothetical protein